MNRTVVDSDWRFDNLCSSHLQSQRELYHVKSRCYWSSVSQAEILPMKNLNVIGAFRSLFRHSYYGCFIVNRNCRLSRLSFVFSFA